MNAASCRIHTCNGGDTPNNGRNLVPRRLFDPEARYAAYGIALAGVPLSARFVLAA